VNISGPINDFNKNLSTFFNLISFEVQNYLIFFILSFLFTQKERTKEKAPEMPTSGKKAASNACLIGATILPEVRAISGLPSRRFLSKT
jgi:hypothetical protein